MDISAVGWVDEKKLANFMMNKVVEYKGPYHLIVYSQEKT